MAGSMERAGDICNGADAADFVESVMSSQRCSEVLSTPGSLGGRKRRASESDFIETLGTTVKKAKRSLYSAAPTPAPRKLVVAQADVHVDGNPSLQHLITKLSADMHMLFGSLSERMDKLESGLEQRISNKVSQLLDKRVNSELSRIRRDIDDRLESFQESIRADVSEELEDINAKLQSISTSAKDDSGHDITKNIIIRGLQETPNENITNKVNSLISGGLKVQSVTCAGAERKSSTNDSKPGIIIATMKSHEDKRKVMSKKGDLRFSNQYSGVFINHDQTRADRIMSSNFRTILSALNHQGLEVKGSRVVRKSSRDRQRSNEGSNVSQQSDHNSSRQRNDDRQGRQQGNNGRGGSYHGNRRNNNRSDNHGGRGSARGQGPRRY